MISYGGGLVTKSCLTLVSPWTVACQAPLSMGFSRQLAILRNDKQGNVVLNLAALTLTSKMLLHFDIFGVLSLPVNNSPPCTLLLPCNYEILYVFI